MGWFFLGIIALALGLSMAELLVRVSPQRLLRYLRWVGVAVAIGVIVLLLVGVRNISLGLLAGLALALLSRSGLFAPKRPFGPGNPSQASHRKTSEVETAYLRMKLDHATGDLEGEVIAGPFAGMRLSDLSFDDLISLLQHCESQDPESVALLETYLERTHGEAWRSAQERREGAPGGGHDHMNQERALEILGLKEGASDEEIRSAHRALMKKLHPDQGGSDYLARQINAAKDYLLANR